MQTVYVQHLLKVLLEEYEDIEYLLDRMERGRTTRRDADRIRQLLDQLGQRNNKLLGRFQAK